MASPKMNIFKLPAINVTCTNFPNKQSAQWKLTRSNPVGQTHARKQNKEEDEKKNSRGGEQRERAEAAKGNRRDSKRHGVGWERGRDGAQGGRIPGLCAPDEFESM